MASRSASRSALRPKSSVRSGSPAAVGLVEAIRRLERLTGFSLREAQTFVRADESFVDWCERLGRAGMKVDGKPFSLADRPALRPLYEAIPSTPEAARDRVLVVMKATQLGMTVWEVLAQIYMAAKWEPVNIGLFLPDQASAAFKSEHRFMRIVRSVPDLAARVGVGAVHTRTLGESILMFLWTSGRVTTESRPMDIVSLDEVQEMTLDQIDKVLARLGDSRIGFCLMLSTANMPDQDIDHWYRLGDQQVWRSECPHCGTLSDLSDPAGAFPDRSIVFNTGQVPGAPLDDYVWTCPACSGWIEDPQRGRMVAANPGAPSGVRSMLYPRTVSPRQTARKTAEAWARARTGDQKKSFYNRTLARPYVDADQLPVTLAHCQAAVAAGRAAGVAWKSSARDAFMGIDQMGGFNAVIVKERLADGRQAVIHVEAVFDEDPFARCSEMMDQYGVAVCVVEQLPNVNDARRFANRHPGRVFLAGYADLRDDAMVWGDTLSRSDRKTVPEARARHTVTLHQYRCMQAALYRIRDGECLFPDPDALIAEVVENGVRRPIPILRDWVFDHLCRTAVVVEQKADERRPRPRVLKVGTDPHFSFANMLCEAAWSRAHGRAGFIMPPATPEDTPRVEGLPPHVSDMLAEAAARRPTCRSCASFDPAGNLCTTRGCSTGPAELACHLHLPA